MTSKSAIIERIGDGGLVLPVVITRALAANDRLKYYLALLQAAHAHATTPGTPAPSLRAEREASGVSESLFDHIVGDSSTIGSQLLHIPRAGAILERLFEDLRLMLHALGVAGRTNPELRDRFEFYKRRLDDLIAHAPAGYDDQVTVKTVIHLLGLPGNGRDSARQLALDLYGELDRLQASVAAEVIDRARVYAVTDADRPLVRAFMRGIAETAHVRLDRPGLATTATRDGGRLSIQTDLGSTDGHVIVVHVTDLTASVTYGDIHRSRARFLHDLLQPYGVQWSAAPPLDTAAEYDTSVGRYTARTSEHLERYLTYLASRLVFLVEWNRARKRLTRLVKKSEAIDLLKWAADNNIGHHAFLRLVDAGVIDAALERAAPLHMRPGARLDEWLGHDAARTFLMTVLRIAATGIWAGRSLSLMEDEIQAELLRNLQTPDPFLLERAAEHASVIAALAEQVRQTLAHVVDDEGGVEASRTAELAKRWSTQADLIVYASRRLDRAGEREMRQLLREADVAADALEEAAFMLTLLPRTVDAQALSLLARLAELVTDMVREYVRCLEQGRAMSPAAGRAEIEDLLVAIDRLLELHREASAMKRAVTEHLLRGPADLQHVHVVGGMARNFERTATSLSRCGATVRDHVLSAPPSR